MITNSKKSHRFTVKGLSALLKGITTNHKGDLYCLSCFDSYKKEKRIKKHGRVCNDMIIVV